MLCLALISSFGSENKEENYQFRAFQTVPATSITLFNRITHRSILDSTTYGEITMYKEFLKLLEKATGRSDHVIAINLDIRGFTPFCQEVDSLNVSTYIKKIYGKIITGYFKNASFYKPTGDGLIIIVPFTEETLEQVANLTINSCLNLLQNFGSLCNDEPMINFPTPEKIGIGLSRGSACCIISEDEDKVLDYSGRILNLASRLMDLARPSGIVLDESFGVNLLPEQTKELFSEETVYVRGVAEETPIKIYYTKKYTLIPESYKQPLREPKWKKDDYEYTFGTLKEVTTEAFELELSRKPLDAKRISVLFSYDNPKAPDELRFIYELSIDDKDFKYRRIGNNYSILIQIQDIIKKIEKTGVSDDIIVKIEIMYPVK